MNIFTESENSDDSALRHQHLLTASNHFRDKNESKAVLHQILALAKGIELSYYSFGQNKFDPFDYAKILEQQFLELQVKSEEREVPTIDDFIEKCKAFPPEWTVIQLTKEYNPMACFQTSEHTMKSNLPIYISLLRYPKWEYNDYQPICIKIETSETKLFENGADLIKTISNYFLNYGDFTDIEERKKAIAQYHSAKQVASDKLLSLMKDTIGPWAFLLCGAARTKEQINAEEQIFAKMVKLASARKLNGRQLALSFLAIRSNLLTEDDVPLIVPQIAGNRTKEKSIMAFLFASHDNKINMHVSVPRNPIVMIVDELLDHFPWEMVLPEHEFTRLYSFGILYELYNKYKANIHKGYLWKTFAKGNVLLNADGSLPDMENRMGEFYKYWLPNFKVVRGKQEKLSSAEVSDLIRECDIFIYGGHGSGLQFIKAEAIMELCLDALVIIFGCSSVGLSSSGFDAMMTGAHIYYHLAQCPTVLGFLYSVTDYSCDLLSVNLLSKFFATHSKTAKTDWSAVDIKKFRSGVIEFLSDVKPINCDKSLQQIVSDIRCDAKADIRLRIAVVARGLPIRNKKS